MLTEQIIESKLQIEHCHVDQLAIVFYLLILTVHAGTFNVSECVRAFVCRICT